MKKKFKLDKHSLIPNHVKLSDRQKEKLLEQYSISLNDLPRLLKIDPALQSLNVKPGDVIKISRKSLTAGEAEFYRVVVDV